MVPKWTAAQIRKQIKKIQEVVEEQRRANKCEQFVAIKPEEIEAKLKRVNSPLIVSQGFTDMAPGGGIVNYDLGIYNPDPIDAEGLFAHVWVGYGTVDPTVGTFLLSVDTRFPRLTEPAYSGLTLLSQSPAILHFALKVPSTVQKTNYLVNSCLMRFVWQGQGTYLDRGVFVFGVM